MAAGKSSAMRTCFSCGEKNPPKAFCCLSCFKEMRGHTHVPWWKREIHLSLPLGLLIIVVTVFGVYRLKSWMDHIEDQISLLTQEK